MVTCSAMVRGIVTALSWFTANERRSSALAELEGAF